MITVRTLTSSLMAALLAIAIAPLAFAKEGGVLLFGGTGRLGVPIAQLLVAAGEDVTVFVRRESSTEALKGLKVRYVVGDLLDEKSIAAAFRKRHYRMVIDASAQRGAGDQVGDYYQSVARAQLKYAAETGVKQFILHGSIGAGANLQQVPQLRNVPGTSRLADKGKAEQIIIDSGVPYTIIRNGLIPKDPQPPPTERAFLTTDLTTMGEVTRGDLAILTLDAMDNPARLNKIYHAIDPGLHLRTDVPRVEPEGG